MSGGFAVEGGCGYGPPFSVTNAPAVLTTSGGSSITGTLTGSTFTGAFPPTYRNAATEKAARVPVECGGRTFVYDGTGALVSTDGVYEEGRGTPEDEATWASARQVMPDPNPYGQSFIDSPQSSSLHGLSGSTVSNWLTAQRRTLTDQSAMLDALQQQRAK